eukprot:jgi/Botrbrau1/5106/Bobra.0128s0017.1
MDGSDSNNIFGEPLASQKAVELNPILCCLSGWLVGTIGLVMESGISQATLRHVLDLLVIQQKETNSFNGIFNDYQLLFQRIRDLQIRNVQLDKEASELRAENLTLRDSAELLQHAMVHNEKARQLEAKVKEMQEELTGVYKEKGRLAEELVATSRQLQVVRDNNEAQGRALDDSGAEMKRLKQRIKELADTADHERDARVLLSSELDERLKAKDAAEAKASQLEAENLDLTRRLVALKEGEAERMNEVHKLHEEMVRNARAMERNMERQMETLADDSRPKRGAAGLLSASGVQAAASGLLSHLGAGRGALKVPTQEGATSIVPERPLRSLQAHDGGCYTIAFDRGGARVASGGADKAVRLWDGSTSAPVGVLHGMLETVTEVVFTCDEKALLAAGSDQALRMWDIASGRVRHTLTGHTSKVSTVDASPLEVSRAASGGADRCVKVWDLRNGYCVATSPYHSACSTLRFTVDGSQIVSGHLDGTLRFWDVRIGKVVHELTGLHNGNITSVAVGHRGGVVLTCGRDHVLKLVDLKTYRVQAAFRAPGFTVSSVWCRACLGPDDKFLAAGSGDGSLFVWEAQSGATAKTLRTGSHSVMATAWSPQGTPLVSGDKHGGITFWQGD